MTHFRIIAMKRSLKETKCIASQPHVNQRRKLVNLHWFCTAFDIILNNVIVRNYYLLNNGFSSIYCFFLIWLMLQ